MHTLSNVAVVIRTNGGGGCDRLRCIMECYKLINIFPGRKTTMHMLFLGISKVLIFGK